MDVHAAVKGGCDGGRGAALRVRRAPRQRGRLAPPAFLPSVAADRGRFSSTAAAAQRARRRRRPRSCPHMQLIIRGSDADATQAAVYRLRVTHSAPHDRWAFTQGLVFRDDGTLYESTGLHGRSEVRKVHADSGRVTQKLSLPWDRFGEGLALSNSTLLQLTWRSGHGYIRDPDTLEEIGSWRFQGDGWGLTAERPRGGVLFLSDGSQIIRVLDADNLRLVDAFAVFDGQRPIKLLNDLQYLNGELWANVWMSELIAVINPATARVKRWVDASGLPQPPKLNPMAPSPDVLNGIAYDPARRSLAVTGKFWPLLFHIDVEEQHVYESVERTNAFFLREARHDAFLRQMGIE